MINFLKSNFQTLFLYLSWIVIGAYGGPVIYVVLPLTLFLLKRNEMYQELLIGFFLILVLSDNRNYIFSFAIDIKDIYIVLLAAFLLFDRRSFVPFNTLYQRFIPFFMVALLCFVWSETFYTSLQKTLSYFLLFFIIPNYVHKIYTQKGNLFFRDFLFFGTLLLLVGFAFLIFSPGNVQVESRFRGVLGNPNGLGIFLLMVFLLAVVIINYYPYLFSKREKILIYAAIFTSLILCESRTTIIAILIFFLFKNVYKISAFLGFILFLVVLLGYQMISDNITNIIVSLGLQEYFRLDTLETGSGRLIAWNFGWNLIQENFFLGKGFGFTDYIYRKNYFHLSMLGHQGNAHNSFITMWLDTGLIGLSLYLWAFVLLFVKASKYTHLAIPIMYAILFSCYFESWLTASLNPFTIQFIIILTIITNDRFFPRKEEDSLPVH